MPSRDWLPAPPFYTFADLAILWKCSTDRVTVYTLAGMLGYVEDAKLGPVVLESERLRFEYEHGDQRQKQGYLNPTERRTYLKIIAAVIGDAWGGFGDLADPHKLSRDIEASADTLGIKLSDRCIADKLKAVRDYLVSERLMPASLEKVG